MEAELKSKLLSLTIGELLDFIDQSPKPQVKPWNRYTIGKLDAWLISITNSAHSIIEFSIHVPEGILCNIKKQEDVENCIKEINTIITKYQK